MLFAIVAILLIISFGIGVVYINSDQETTNPDTTNPDTTNPDTTNPNENNGNSKIKLPKFSDTPINFCQENNSKNCCPEKKLCKNNPQRCMCDIGQIFDCDKEICVNKCKCPFGTPCDDCVKYGGTCCKTCNNGFFLHDATKYPPITEPKEAIGDGLESKISENLNLDFARINFTSLIPPTKIVNGEIKKTNTTMCTKYNCADICKTKYKIPTQDQLKEKLIKVEGDEYLPITPCPGKKKCCDEWDDNHSCGCCDDCGTISQCNESHGAIKPMDYLDQGYKYWYNK